MTKLYKQVNTTKKKPRASSRFFFPGSKENLGSVEHAYVWISLRLEDYLYMNG